MQNAALHATAHRSQGEASRARAELQQVQQEAQTLHQQLSGVIAGFTATGLSSPVQLPLLGPPPPRPAMHHDNTVSPAGASSVGPLPSTSATSSAPLGAALNGLLPPSWRGPATPTSLVPPASSAVRTLRTSSASENELLLDGLRQAMATLDGGSDDGLSATVPAAVGAAPAAEMLTKIANGISSLGQRDDDIGTSAQYSSTPLDRAKPAALPGVESATTYGLETGVEDDVFRDI